MVNDIVMMWEEDNEILRPETPPDSDTLDDSHCTGSSEIVHVQQLKLKVFQHHSHDSVIQ